ncbi:MAG: putative ATP-grasp superfamily ATP-dependent carboligase [Acidimicrobiales bacterium]
MKKEKNIIAYVMNLTPRMADDIREYEIENSKTYRIMLIWDSKIKRPDTKKGFDILVECDFSKPWKIAEALLPYQDQLTAITCRSEANISRFAQVLPHVPYLRSSNTESLRWATDKYEMRKRLRLFDKKNTPKFTWVKENTKKERTRVIEKVSFPMIVKPANLAGSLFVTICYHEEELEKTLRTQFRKLQKAYENNNRTEVPKIIAEEYMEGDLYSIDSYVNARGDVYHCPMVRQKTGREMGHDDFYNYLQMTPSALKLSTVERAHKVAETAIHALGLRSITAHVELMKVDDEWKVIEVGPRCGGARDILHKLSCDINHTMNDVLIRIPRKPVVPKKCKGFAAYLKYFADKEGVILETKGIKKIEGLESFHSIVINKKVGDRSVFARNGGRSMFNLYLYNSDRSKLLADIRRIEQMVKVKVENGRGKKK